MGKTLYDLFSGYPFHFDKYKIEKYGFDKNKLINDGLIRGCVKSKHTGGCCLSFIPTIKGWVFVFEHLERNARIIAQNLVVDKYSDLSDKEREEFIEWFCGKQQGARVISKNKQKLIEAGLLTCEFVGSSYKYHVTDTVQKYVDDCLNSVDAYLSQLKHKEHDHYKYDIIVDEVYKTKKVIDEKTLDERAEQFRANPTEKEALMIKILDSLGVKYTYQQVLFPYIADFHFTFNDGTPKCVIEIDGEIHNKDYDEKRDKWLLFKHGVPVYRFTNDEVQDTFIFKYLVLKLLGLKVDVSLKIK